MTKFLTAFLSILSYFVMAQNQRFSYEYKFVPDSTNRADVKMEMMNLDVTKEGSRFYSYTVYQSDSTMKVDMEKQLAATNSINIKSGDRKGLVKYSVTKEYPQYKVFFHHKILRDQYRVLDERLLVWKISNESQKIGIWKTQKANTTFGGRAWTAWFASEIPIQDGPYKFHGLPGLIVKLEDDSQSHTFELKEIIALKDVKTDVFGTKEISINLNQYNKAIKDYENDPTKGMRQLQMGATVMIMKDGENTNMKEQEERIKNRIKKDNNRIELSK